MLTITVPDLCIAEHKWILKVLFNQFLGIDYVVECGKPNGVTISQEERILELPVVFFNSANEHWLDNESLPKRALQVWDTKTVNLDFSLVNTKIPVIFGKPEINVAEKSITLGLDILGSCFFMLSRYEEALKCERDQHNRFPGRKSLAAREQFLKRPIVNEYLEILWSCLHYLWPGLVRKQRNFRLIATCDVDFPYDCGVKRTFAHAIHVSADVIKRRNVKLAIKNCSNYFKSRRGDYGYDPYYPYIDWIMDQNELLNNQVIFYFLAGQTDHRMDTCYSLDEPILRSVIRRIDQRGHLIGIHPSYNTYDNLPLLQNELNNLRCVLKEEKINFDNVLARQHYLRCKIPDTLRNWQEAGIDMDSTLGYADSPGFRCGTCYEYSLYDVWNRKELQVIERPLVVMESSIISSAYLGLGYSESAINMFLELKNNCKIFSGDFVLLWHNSHFGKQEDQEFYKAIIA